MNKNKLFVSLLAAGMLATSPIMADDVVTLTTNKSVGETITLKLNQLKHGATIDWGNGTSVAIAKTSQDVLTITGKVEGSTIKITSPSKIETLICEGQNLTKIDIAKAPNLRSLYCQNNELTALDVTSNAKLTDLNCANNQLKTLKINETSNPLIENVNVANNSIKNNAGNTTSTSFSIKTASLQQLNISNNSINSVSLLNNTSLDVLKCANNNLSSLVTKSDSISVVMCGNNKISTLTVNGSKENLRQLFAENNKISTIDVSTAENLKYIAVENNGVLKTVKLYNYPAANKLYAYTCGGNNLTFASFPQKARVSNISYLPQEETFNISSKLLKTTKDGVVCNYIFRCPSNSDYTTEYNADKSTPQYLLKLSDWATDGNGQTYTIKFSYIGTSFDSDENIYEAIAKSAMIIKSAAKYAGIVAFTSKQKDAYVEMTSTNYPDLTLKSTHFSVVDDINEIVTGIDDAVISKDNTLELNATRGMLNIHSNAPQVVRIYSAEGKLIWQGVVDGVQQVQLTSGIYIVNGKKVVL